MTQQRTTRASGEPCSQKRFMYLEYSAGGWRSQVVPHSSQLQLPGWGLVEDRMLALWMLGADVGDVKEHRLGVCVRLKDARPEGVIGNKHVYAWGVEYTDEELAKRLIDMSPSVDNAMSCAGGWVVKRAGERLLELLNQPATSSPEGTCLWRQDDSQNEFFFTTACGQEHVNKEDSFLFCPYCSQKLITRNPRGKTADETSP